MPQGRKPGFRMSEEHRVKIQNSNVLNALVEHVEGKRDMSSSQVTAGIALLKKVLPDLSHNENEHTHDLADPLRDLLEDVARNGKRLGQS